jgi:polyhydroxybutyrate depolymerase
MQRIAFSLSLAATLVACHRGRTDHAPSLASAQAPHASSGDGADVRSMSYGGLTRTFYLHKGGSANHPQPLVLVLHGGGGTGKAMVDLTRGGFDRIADREGAIVAYPDGIEKNWNDGRTDTGHAATSQNVDDVGFLSELVDTLVREENADPKRVYVTGISNGGIMYNRLGCERSDRFAAIAPDVGALAPEVAAGCKAGRALPVLAINGTADPLVPFNGGEVHFGRKQLGVVLSTHDTIATWLVRDKCSPQATVTVLPDRDPSDGTTVKLERWDACAPGAEVQLYTIEGGGHTWPGGEQYMPKPVVGNVCRDFDGAEVIWEFFKRHPRA